LSRCKPDSTAFAVRAQRPGRNRMRDMKSSKQAAIVILAFLATFALVCTRDYNPFADTSRAQASVERSSFGGGDTLEVFCRETLDVAVAVAELVDSFTLTVPGNRLFGEDTTIVVGTFAPYRYRFVVSFYDTGWQTVGVLSHRQGGEQSSESYDVYVRSPLGQDTVRGTFDDTVHLVSRGVRDADVVYHWDFGRGSTVESPFPDAVVTIEEAGFDGVGYLWVSDAQEMHACPKVKFVHEFNDTIGPRIVCVNEGSEGRDTIKTGSSTFFFRVEITDRGKAPDSASIGGAAFDQVEGTVYVKALLSMDTLTGLVPVVVWARDNRADNNISTRTFYLGYDANLPSTAEGVRIRIRIPSRDSTVSSSRQRYVLGTVENYTGEQVVLRVSVNGVFVGSADTLSAEFSTQWSRGVYLSAASNGIEARATSLSGALLDSAVITMLYDSTAADSVAPTILEITLGGEAAHGQYVGDEEAQLRILAFDEGWGISSLTVNGIVRQASDTVGVWRPTVVLSHGSGGNGIVVVASDSAGHSTDTSIVMFQNRSPEVKVGLSPPYPIVLGVSYRDTLIAEDGDGDRVYYEKAVGPLRLSVGEDGAVDWEPTIADTGRYQLIIRYRDGIVSQLYSCSLTVVDSVYYENTVAFSVDERDFPAYVEAGKDTVRVTLSMVANAGSPPFSYNAIRRAGASYVDVAISGNEFVWAPQPGDTGYQHFTIRVSDQLLRADTLYPVVLVVPPNRPCSLHVSYSIDTLADGSLDLRDARQPETLFFWISDSDPEEVEQYTVNVKRAGTNDVRSVGKADTFTVVIDASKATSAQDSLVVVVRDRGQFGDTISLVLRYSFLKVIMNTSPSGANVTANVYNFPVLVRLTSAEFDFSQTQSDGSDIRFRKADGTALPHEIERFDASGQRAEIWVRVDTVYASNSTQFFEMSWGDAGAPGGSNAAAVFDTANGFAGVWHLSEDPSAAGRPIKDHTANGNDGSTCCGMTTGNSISAIAGRGLEFDGNADYVKIDAPAVSLEFTDTITLSAWVNAQSVHLDVSVIIGRQYGTSWYDSYVMYLNASGAPGFLANDNSAGGLESDAGLDLGRWYHLCAVKKGSRHELYRDGILDAGSSGWQMGAFHDPNEVIIGGNMNGTGVERQFHGGVDEVRASRAARSAAWIKLEYENQKQESSFLTME